MLSRWNQYKPRPVLAHFECLESRRLLSAITYYLSPSGSDSNSGTSTALPWKTIARANEQTYTAGDSLLMQGGASFAGDLSLVAADSGTSSSPVTVSSYGSGQASILAGKTDGITVRDAGGITISNLIITGSGPTVNTGSGIDLIDDQTNKARIGYITINNVKISGFGFVGIGIGSTTVTTGFTNVSITNSTVFNNSYSGVFSYAGNYTANPAQYGLAHTDIYVDNVTAYDNPGHSGNNDSGNGIELGNVNGATIQDCTAYGNGADNSSTGGGPVGIWTYNSNDVLIQDNQSYSNTAAHLDGDGYDLDGGTTNSIVQYNYSHDNAGAGILEAQFAEAQPSTGNIIRYNVSQNDGRTQSQSGISLWSASASDTISGTQIYGNSVYVTKSSVGSPSALQIDQATDNVTVRNNLFDVATGLKTVVVKYTGSGLLFQDNDYWTGSATAIGITWGSSTYQTLATWRSATGEEKLGSTSTGLAVNPLLENTTATPNTGTDLPSVTDFELASDSPLITAGLNLSSVGIDPGSTDYFGDPLPSNTTLAIGADQPAVSKQPLTLSSSSAASFYLSPSADGTLLDIWQNASTPGSGTPTSTIEIAELSSVQITGGAGSNLTVDLSTDDTLSSLPITFTGTSQSTLTVIGTNKTDTIALTSSVLTIDLTPITYFGTSSININAGTVSATLTQTQQPSATVNFIGTGADLLIVQTGVYTFTGTIAATNLSVFDEASVVFAASSVSGVTTRQLTALNISAGASAEVTPAAVHANRLLLVLGELTIASTGHLDLQNNDMLIHNGNISTVSSLLAPRSKGIESTVVASDTTGTLALGAILNTIGSGTPLYGNGTALGLFDGYNAVATDVLVKFTYVGDANLDGKVDGSDYNRIDNGGLMSLTSWFNGDFNYDGTINTSDFTLIDQADTNQGAQL